MSILSKPWFVAILALFIMVGTQLAALKLYWDELFPKPEANVLVVKRDDPAPFTWGFSSDEIRILEEELKTQIAALQSRKAELDAYAARLDTDKAEIEDIKKQVELMQEKLLDGIVRLEDDEQKNLRTLAKTYSTLTPEAAVTIFRELDDATVVKILFFMKTDTVGAILQEMATANGGNAGQIKRAANISNLLRLFTNNTANDSQQNI